MNPYSRQLDRQAKRLIAGASSHRIPESAMKIITNVLRTIADQLDFPVYTLLTAKNGGWLKITLSNRNFPEQEKQVVYAYPSYEIAQIEANKLLELQPYCQEIGTIDLLFQLLALTEIDSLIFLNQSRSGKEINRNELYNLCQKQLQSPTYLA
ncbi:MAG: hypothetical protein CV045_02435 [Cyanobacteria bacterium M5B4]|nr:hypothetical protein [Cyanobacteria bacterium KgW148]PLS69370.1 MAG: hypothetical protein CV045_02435 [Cyanobacteria bacterium M5B4]